MWDYLNLIAVSILGSLTMITKAKAMQYELASRISILGYLSIIFMLIFDLILFNTVF